MPPPPRPCRMRNSSSDCRFQAKPHSTELSVNRPGRRGRTSCGRASREKRARRQDDRVGDQIGGHHPGRFVLADAHAAGDIGQRDIGDGGVEHLHEGGERDQHARSATGWPARARPRAGARCIACVRRSQPGSQPLVERRRRDRRARSARPTCPGPSATSVGGLSMTIFTGTRWTILT